MSNQSLNDQLTGAEDLGFLQTQIPKYIKENLNEKIALRPYQEQAISRFSYYIKSTKRPKSCHLLFNMATGSGKTIVMASLILEAYKLGYRNFLFFVNSTNILDKTRQNFLNKQSSKYLFSNSIKFSDLQVKIREVANFESANNSSINICFTTIQGLHISLNNPSENSLTFEDFAGKKIAIISDEAHHINSATKLGKTEEKEKESWERTVMKILNTDDENVMLEFTATIDLKNTNIAAKYNDKIIFEYNLKKFREEKYSKDIYVLKGDLSKIDRALQAVIVSQYRKKIAARNGLNIKPVILMKSQNIEPSKLFREEFHHFIENLTAENLLKIKSEAKENNILKLAFDFFDEQKISMQNLILELKNDFSHTKTININDTKEAEQNQILVNSLEDQNNEIRVIFAVDKLNEGWDVLNLFDIVRLYETRDSGKPTIKEAQLIGRGARYCPFAVNADQEKFKRKYDGDFKSELRILEQLHYHCFDEPRYISEITKELRKIGILEDARIEMEFKTKDQFKETEFYKSGYIYLNKKITNKREDIFSIKDYGTPSLIQGYKIHSGNIGEERVFDDNLRFREVSKTDLIPLKRINRNIIKNALDRLDFFKFSNLKKHFPKLNSIDDFIDDLQKISVEVSGNSTQISNLNYSQKLGMILHCLEFVKNNIDEKSFDYEGDKVFKPKLIKEILKDKILKFAINYNENDKEFGKSANNNISKYFGLNLGEKDWYIHNDNFGTNEEKAFIKYLSDNTEKLKQIYDEFYLLRNEKYFDLFSFDGGRKIEPDFALFLKKKQQNKMLILQLFIEPKGEDRLISDQWKEDFLKEIFEKNKSELIYQGKEYKLYGLPFYNEKIRKYEFDQSFRQILAFEHKNNEPA